jgi:tetratricopeptide (TPR) repeat protein
VSAARTRRALAIAALLAAPSCGSEHAAPGPAPSSEPTREARASYERAILQLGRDANREAVAELREAVRLSPGWDDAWRLLGTSASNANDFATAIEATETLLERRPKDADAAALLADISLRQGDLPRCARALHLLEQSEPGEARTLLLRARHYVEIGKLDLADRYAQRVLRADDSQAQAWFYRGLWAEEEGRDEDAIAHYKRALKHNPGQLGARDRLATLSARLGHTRDAERNRAIHAAIIASTTGSYRQRPPDERVAQFKAVVDLVPEWSRGYLELGRAQLELNKNDEAQVTLERAAELESTPEVHRLLARLMLRKKRFQAADRHAVLAGVPLEALRE